MNEAAWSIVEPDLPSILRQHPRPLEALAAGVVPAVVLRSAWPAAACRALVARLIAEDLLYDPRLPIPEKFHREGRTAASQAWEAHKTAGRTRIDLGTSLGYRGSDRAAFFAHARQTHDLFARLFADGDNPIRTLYECLQQLARDRRVVTAYEPDGRQYGPAIIRAHYGGYTYKPHFDSVRLREKRTDYAVHDFEHQLAGVLVLQNSQRGDQTAQCILHRCLWTPEVDPHLRNDTFHEFAREQRIAQVEVRLEPGDLYFFNTRLIHEVPGLAGELPRIVLATFIGYSPDREEIFVWS